MKTLNIIFTIAIIVTISGNTMAQNVLPTEKANAVYTQVKKAEAGSTLICKDITIEQKQNNVDCVAIMNDGIIQDENSVKAAGNNTQATAMPKKDIPSISIEVVKQ